MQKNELISYLIKTGYLKTKIIIDAFYSVPREEFVLPEYKKYAYTNDALPLIEGQTISHKQLYYHILLALLEKL